MSKTAPDKTEKVAAPKAAAEPLKPIAPLLQGEIWARETGVRFNTWEVVPPARSPIENVLRRDFWANVSGRMRTGDSVIVVPRDGAWYAELIVWDAGQNWADMSVKCKVDRPQLAAVPGIESDFEIVSDPIDGVVVRRRSTGQKVKDNFPNHEDARRWLLEHQRALRA